MLLTHVFFGGVEDEVLQLAEARVDPGTPSLLHDGLVTLQTKSTRSLKSYGNGQKLDSPTTRQLCNQFLKILN